MALNLLTLLDIDDPSQYKFHAARWNKDEQPLDVFIRDRDQWHDWNTWRGTKDEFNLKYIISFIHFYYEEWIWLFGGIYEVKGRGGPHGHTYDIELCDNGRDLIGRLKIRLVMSRGRSFRFENHYHDIVVTELLKEPYSGQAFVGYDNITLHFPMLEAIIRNQRLDWKTALQNVKGVYVIVDRSTGKKYVGSAYNNVGIWARWRTYVETGHGWNVELVNLQAEAGIEYARKHFQITLLENWPFKTDDRVIIGRESYWKEALLTRGDFGYNRN